MHHSMTNSVWRWHARCNQCIHDAIHRCALISDLNLFVGRYIPGGVFDAKATMSRPNRVSVAGQ